MIIHSFLPINWPRDESVLLRKTLRSVSSWETNLRDCKSRHKNLIRPFVLKSTIPSIYQNRLTRKFSCRTRESTFRWSNMNETASLEREHCWAPFAHWSFFEEQGEDGGHNFSRSTFVSRKGSHRIREQLDTSISLVPFNTVKILANSPCDFSNTSWFSMTKLYNTIYCVQFTCRTMRYFQSLFIIFLIHLRWTSFW